MKMAQTGYGEEMLGWIGMIMKSRTGYDDFYAG